MSNSNINNNNNATSSPPLPSSSSSAAASFPCPIVLRDPRFKAGRSLVQKGLAQEGAIEMFATLVEEVSIKYGESSIETAPAYYEYGNALLRASMAAGMNEGDEEEDNHDNDNDDDDEKEDNNNNNGEEQKDLRKAAAIAAEKRFQQQQQQKEKENGDEQNNNEDSKPSVDTATTTTSTSKKDLQENKDTAENNNGNENSQSGSNVDEGENIENDENESNNEEDEVDGGDTSGDNNTKNDLSLALEMMENSFSILEDYQEAATKTTSTSTLNEESNSKQYLSWVQEEFPRILLGIGDALSALNRHADAADAYSRVLELRQTQLQQCISKDNDNNSNNSNNNLSLQTLQAHRRVCEATILIAETLLAYPNNYDKDVITTETKTLIVKGSERIEYARGYYDKARDALQETVFYMGKLIGSTKKRNSNHSDDELATEKENVCFIATMVMGVGETLATIDEENKGESNDEPAKKKAKL